MITRTIKFLGLNLAVWSIATASYAVETGFYMGIQAGSTNVNYGNKSVFRPDFQFKAGTKVNTHSTLFPNVSPGNSGIGERLFVGGQFNPYFAVEFGYTHYAASTFNVPASPIFSGSPQVRTLSLDLVGKGIFQIPCAGIGVFGKAGVAAISSSASGSFQPVVLATGKRIGSGSNLNKTTASFIYGAGISYDIAQTWVVELFATKINAAGGIPSATFMGLGFSYHFVDKKCGQFLC